jgi:hypothetical protein
MFLRANSAPRALKGSQRGEVVSNHRYVSAIALYESCEGIDLLEYSLRSGKGKFGRPHQQKRD